MKRILMLLALSVSALLAEVPREIHVRLDQAVMVNETRLPAGDYTIQVINASGGDTPMLVLKSKQASVIALASRQDTSIASTGDAHLILQVKDGVYHLDKLIAGGTTFQLQ